MYVCEKSSQSDRQTDRQTDRLTDRQTDRYLYLKLIPEELVMCLFPLLIAQTSMVLVTIHTSIWIGMNAKLVR